MLFFNDTATTEIYTLSLHDALPISAQRATSAAARSASTQRLTRPTAVRVEWCARRASPAPTGRVRSLRVVRRLEEHMSEVQSRQYLGCRLLVEKKKVRSSARALCT